VPHPAFGPASISPPCAETMREEIARPRPVPFSLVVKNGSKMRGRWRRVDAGAFVDHLDDVPCRIGRFADAHAAPWGARVNRIGNDVHEHFLHLAGINADGGIGGRPLDLERDAAALGLGMEQRRSVFDDHVECGVLQIRTPRSGVGQEVAHESVQTVELFLAEGGELRLRGASGHSARNNLERALHARQRRADLVRKPGGDLTQHRQPFSPPQVLL
jgi:hypothetical protein